MSHALLLVRIKAQYQKGVILFFSIRNDQSFTTNFKNKDFNDSRERTFSGYDDANILQ